ncbi:carotenoid biosynthesis protein [Novosphingobium bradum]|uniref:Carotenoid biosynthesis protein n=1 Tax=Novosphingobium bradum TaxID=1737444 RepID=A0ABV7ITK2_9SPHN
MFFGFPTTWIAHDLLAMALYSLCVVHATRHPEATQRTLMLLGFTLFAAMFENIGVGAGRYFYDPRRLALVGAVPLGVLILESVIFYAAMTLLDHLRVPAWAKPFAAGMLMTLQDLSIDPTAVNDRYATATGGSGGGQWTWIQHYADTYFGIPYANFSGWFHFTFAFVVAFQVVCFVLRRAGLAERMVANAALPFLAAIGGVFIILTPFTVFMIDLSPLLPPSTHGAELAMLATNLALGTAILLATARPAPLDWARDGAIVVAAPMLLHGYDIAVAFARGLSIAYLPAIVVPVIHAGLLVVLLRRGARGADARANGPIGAASPEI